MIAGCCCCCCCCCCCDECEWLWLLAVAAANDGPELDDDVEPGPVLAGW